MTESEFLERLGRHQKFLDASATKLSGGDRDLREDLRQEAMCALWRFELARVRGNEASLLRDVIRSAMVGFLRRERLNRLVPLDAILGDDGTPVEELEDRERPMAA